MNAAGNRLAILVLLGLFSWGLWRILDHPAALPATAAVPARPLVETLSPEARPQPIQAHAFGRIQAWDARAIRPQVDGRITHLHPDFEPGGLIPAGQTLVQIDDHDYRLAVEAARAELDKAEARLAIEGGKRRVAREELRLLADAAPLDKRSRALALRAPQLREARADVLAAKIALRRAQLQLQRTRIQTDQDLVVLDRQRSTGELVSRGERIGQVADASRARLVLLIDPALLTRLSPGADVRIRYQTRDYQGRLVRIQRRLSDKTRQAQVTVAVDDPYNRLPQHANRPPLLIGSYVEARIDAGHLPASLRVPREWLRDGNRIWVVDAHDRLQLRPVQVLFKTPDQVYIAPLGPGERLLKGQVSGLLPGTRVRSRPATEQDRTHAG
jgi:RND family efflux transporter MFP subunit